MAYQVFSETLTLPADPGFGSITMSILSILLMGTFLAQFVADVGAVILNRMSSDTSDNESGSISMDEDLFYP